MTDQIEKLIYAEIIDSNTIVGKPNWHGQGEGYFNVPNFATDTLSIKKSKITVKEMRNQLKTLLPAQQLEDLNKAFSFLQRIKIQLPPVSSGIFYRDTKRLFYWPSEEVPTYKLELINKFHDLAWEIIQKNLDDPAVIAFIQRSDTFIDFHTDSLQHVHGGNTKIRKHICEAVMQTPQSKRYEDNPFLEHLGDSTNGEANKKRVNRFSFEFLTYLLHNTNTLEENLGFMVDAYIQIANGTIPYAPTGGVKELKDLKFRHLGILCDAIIPRLSALSQKQPIAASKLAEKLIKQGWIKSVEIYHQDLIDTAFSVHHQYHNPDDHGQYYSRDINDNPLVQALDEIKSNGFKNVNKFTKDYVEFTLSNYVDDVTRLTAIAQAYAYGFSSEAETEYTFREDKGIDQQIKQLVVNSLQHYVADILKRNFNTEDYSTIQTEVLSKDALHGLVDDTRNKKYYNCREKLTALDELRNVRHIPVGGGFL